MGSSDRGYFKGLVWRRVGNTSLEKRSERCGSGAFSRDEVQDWILGKMGK
jgi:hypothetical protein